MDVDSDISVMETMLGRDTGGAARDFNVSSSPKTHMPGTDPAIDFGLGGSAAQGK